MIAAVVAGSAGSRVGTASVIPASLESASTSVRISVVERGGTSQVTAGGAVGVACRAIADRGIAHHARSMSPVRQGVRPWPARDERCLTACPLHRATFETAGETCAIGH